MVQYKDDFPPELEKEYNRIMGIQSSGKKIIDEAYDNKEEDELDIKDELIDDTEDETKDKEDVIEEEDKDTSESEDNDEEEDIPERLIKAGKAYDFSDEKIVELANESPDVLDALADAYEKSLKTKAASTDVGQRKQEPVVKDKADAVNHEVLDNVEVGDISKLQPEAQEIIKALGASQNVLIDKFNLASKNAVSAQEKEQNDFSRFIDNHFDDKIEDCPALGKTEFLSPEQEGIRQQVYGFAAVLQQTEGGKLEDSLDRAIDVYNSLTQGEKNAEVALVRKVNKNKKRFSARPGGQKTKPKYKNSDEEAMDVMDKAGQDLGVW